MVNSSSYQHWNGHSSEVLSVALLEKQYRQSLLVSIPCNNWSQEATPCEDHAHRQGRQEDCWKRDRGNVREKKVLWKLWAQYKQLEKQILEEITITSCPKVWLRQDSQRYKYSHIHTAQSRAESL